MRQAVMLTMLACVVTLVGPLVAAAEDTTDPSATLSDDAQPEQQLTHAQLQRMLDRYRHRTWHWQRIMGRPLTLTLKHPPQDPLRRIAVWKRIAASTKSIAQHPPHLRDWSCIHRFEGAWTDPNAPYYGGLQMDLGFQRRYGRRLLARKGTADHWTPLEQMWVAERALRSGRGFYPWPNTARYCGLI
jgi:hypothetical protein